MKVAVSGATGFIGRYIVLELLKRSIEPILLVRPDSIKLLNDVQHVVVPFDLDHIPNKNLYQYIHEPDVLIHCAWSSLDNYKSPCHFEIELPRQYQFLSALIRDGLQHVLVTGTSFEYGNRSGALSEDMIPNPDNPYGFAKHSLYQQIKFNEASARCNMTWARLFYLYGDGQPSRTLFSQLKQAVSQGDKTFNMSGGEQLRDYLPASLAAEYIVSLALSKRPHGVVNICSGKPVSVRKIVENWLLENNWEIDLNLGYYPYPDYEPLAFWGSRERMDECLNIKKELS